VLNTAQKTEASGAEQELTDSLHLVIGLLKLDVIDKIYGVPGIPITDLGCMAQAAELLPPRAERRRGMPCSHSFPRGGCRRSLRL
jgi:oxalyl-CoA decarboxylase